MHPLPAFLLGFSLAAAVAWFFRRLGMRKIRGLEREKEDLLTEESRVFSFLHEISTSLGGDRTQRRLHEDIVHGIARVVGADAAALYLTDNRSGSMLIPAALTRDCPPLIELPEAQRHLPLSAISSWLQLTATPAHDGLLGSCLASQIPVNSPPLSGHGPWSSSLAPSQEGIAVMIAPLISAGRRIGDVDVAQHKGHPPFSPHAFDVFRSAAEQCAFALASAVIVAITIAEDVLVERVHVNHPTVTLCFLKQVIVNLFRHLAAILPIVADFNQRNLFADTCINEVSVNNIVVSDIPKFWVAIA